MLKEERRQRIIRILQSDRTAKVSDLARQLKSSRATIWRDIDDLAAKGQVVKVHGGATLVETAEESAGIERRLELLTPQAGLRIGFQAPEATYYYGPVITGARRACELAGARLVVMLSGYAPDDVRETLATLEDTGVDGLLMSPTAGYPDAGPGPWEIVNSMERPVVLVERECPGLDLGGVRSVSTAHEAGVYSALQHLKGLGHQRVGLVAQSDRGDPMRRVTEGWRTASRALGLNADLEVAPEWIAQDPDEIVAAIKAVGVTAVLCMNDAMAGRMLRAFRRQGVSIPDDLSVIAYDDEIAEILKPPLTAVSPDREMVGFVAAQQLMTLLSNGDPGPGRRVHIDPRLVERGSTAPPS